MFKVMARYYANGDNFGESYVITNDNEDPLTNFEIGEKIVVGQRNPQQHMVLRGPDDGVQGGLKDGEVVFSKIGFEYLIERLETAFSLFEDGGSNEFYLGLTKLKLDISLLKQIGAESLSA